VDGNTKIVARGIIDPQEAYLFGRWEREGIRAFVDIDEKKLDERLFWHRCGSVTPTFPYAA
jgi:hypothetical protein